jgi:predicted TIM-barrel fold metal-dependent hydrolase
VSAVIDVHPHVISSDTARYPRDPLGGSQSDWSRDRPVSVEAMVAAMDEAGVSRSALVQAATCYGYDNRYLADAVAAFPGRFAGVFSVDVFRPEAPERIRHWMKAGLHGLRVFIAGHTMASKDARLDDPRAHPAWTLASELGLTVSVQLRAAGLPQLEAVIARFPRVRILLDHMARPLIEDGPPYANASGLFALSRHPNLFLKLTTHNLRESRKGKATPETFFARVAAEFGAARLAWGSNYPASEGTLAGLLADARAALAALPEKDLGWIFSGTAASLYPSLAGA